MIEVSRVMIEVFVYLGVNYGTNPKHLVFNFNVLFIVLLFFWRNTIFSPQNINNNYRQLMGS